MILWDIRDWHVTCVTYCLLKRKHGYFVIRQLQYLSGKLHCYTIPTSCLLSSDKTLATETKLTQIDFNVSEAVLYFWNKAMAATNALLRLSLVSKSVGSRVALGSLPLRRLASTDVSAAVRGNGMKLSVSRLKIWLMLSHKFVLVWCRCLPMSQVFLYTPL